MAETNEHGLSRYIPANIRREIRRRSKFGCVICRRGFYQYEHIDPPFEDAKEHDPSHMCCLCGGCHDSVTRGHLSKQLVKSSYQRTQDGAPDRVGPPIGPLDFHKGNAELLIGGLFYSPAISTVLRYHGTDLVRVIPGIAGAPGMISATFTDDDGHGILALDENEWVGSLENWDIEVVGQRITVRRQHGHISLQLRLDPPGRIVVERLDMRFEDAHVLATEQTYAVGRYVSATSVHWVQAQIKICSPSAVGVAIEFTDPQSLEKRDLHFRDTCQELATDDRQIVMSASSGVMIKPLGIAIGTLCGSFQLRNVSVGERSLDDMRRVIVDYPEQVGKFISSGTLA